MGTKRKLAQAIEDILRDCHVKGYTIEDSMQRMAVAEHIVEQLLQGRDQYRSGRRISDRLKDRLIAVQKWVRGS